MPKGSSTEAAPVNVFWFVCRLVGRVCLGELVFGTLGISSDPAALFPCCEEPMPGHPLVRDVSLSCIDKARGMRGKRSQRDRARPACMGSG